MSGSLSDLCAWAAALTPADVPADVATTARLQHVGLAGAARRLAALPGGAEFGDGAEAQKAYDLILGSTPRILVASFVAYLIGEYANSVVLARMKVATGGRWLWTRTIGSTVVGEGLDSTVFITLAFYGMPGFDIPSAIMAQWILKVIYETAVTPFTYWLVTYLKAREGIDVYDADTSFNPLPLAH